jgi:hypothetical protein
MTIDDVYVSFWGKPKKQFSEMEIALMEGGHSLEKESKYDFLKSLPEVNEACWKDYKQVGMKKKGKRTVPNCVLK